MKIKRYISVFLVLFLVFAVVPRIEAEAAVVTTVTETGRTIRVKATEANPQYSHRSSMPRPAKPYLPRA